MNTLQAIGKPYCPVVQGSHDYRANLSRMHYIDRRSIAVFPPLGDLAHAQYSTTTAAPYSPDDVAPPSPFFNTARGPSRSPTVLRHDDHNTNNPSLAVTPLSDSFSPTYNAHLTPEVSSPQTWSPNFAQLPTPNEQHESSSYFVAGGLMNAANTPGKTSSDSGQNAALDRWSQRRLQRLNTEQGFREQRQGGQVLSPPLHAASISSSGSNDTAGYNNASQSYPNSSSTDAPPHSSAAQPHGGYQTSRSAPANTPNVGLAIQTPSMTSASRPSPYSTDSQLHMQQTYSPPDHYAQQDSSRPNLSTARSFSTQSVTEDSSMSNNAALSSSKSARVGNGNRQSVHNGVASREGSHATPASQIPAFNASIVPPSSQGQPYKGAGQQQQQGDMGRGTPQPQHGNDEMSEEDIAQLVKDHKELRKADVVFLNIPCTDIVQVRSIPR